MSDLAATRAAKSSHFAHGVVGKVVVEHEAALKFAFLEIVHELLVVFRAQRRRNYRLCFAARKQG